MTTETYSEMDAIYPLVICRIAGAGACPYSFMCQCGDPHVEDESCNDDCGFWTADTGGWLPRFPIECIPYNGDISCPWCNPAGDGGSSFLCPEHQAQLYREMEADHELFTRRM